MYVAASVVTDRRTDRQNDYRNPHEGMCRGLKQHPCKHIPLPEQLLDALRLNNNHGPCSYHNRGNVHFIVTVALDKKPAKHSKTCPELQVAKPMEFRYLLQCDLIQEGIAIYVHTCIRYQIMLQPHYHL